jgi:hypothetical protein
MAAVGSEPRAELLVRSPGGSWAPPAVSAYGNEAELRDLLASQPSLIPGVSGAAATVTEFPVPGSGYADVVAVDASGAVAVVECKLAGNPEMRRSIIGQVLAYAASLWRLEFADFDHRWSGRRPMRDGVVAAVLGEDAGEEAEDLRAAVGESLSDGRFGLVLAVDSITPELRRTVEYLNAHTISEVSIVALELRYARHGEVEVLIPRIYGAELAESVARPGRRRPWGEDDYLEALGRQGPVVDEIGRRVLEHFRERADTIFFGEGATPSLTPAFGAASGGRVIPFTLYLSTPPLLAANFEWTRACTPEARRAFVDAVVAIPGAGMDADAIIAADLAKRPSLRILDLPDPLRAADAFVRAVDVLLDSVVERGD